MYFDQTKFISNSDLSSLKRMMNKQEFGESIETAFNFGNLVEAYIEERPADEFEGRSTTEQIERAKLMDEATKADPTARLFLETHSKQHEVYRNAFEVIYQGEPFQVHARGKLDLCNKQFRTGGDFKTTACTSQQQFNQSILHFDYHRAAAWYMDLMNLHSFMFIGISKQKDRFTKKHRVFRFAVMRDDANYKAGKAKYSFLCYKYYHLIYNLNLNLNSL